jgi:hypothetical protein
MNALLANFPEVALLLSLFLSVVFWRVIKILLAVVAVGMVLLLVVGMAGYGFLELLTR